MQKLVGKIAIITGASQGIGRAVAQRLYAEGASLVLASLPEHGNAVDVVKQIGASGDRTLVVEGDLRQRAIGGAIAGAIAVVIGFIFVFTDAILQKLDLATILTTLYVPVVIGDLIGTIILVPILVYAWEPVKAQLGR